MTDPRRSNDPLAVPRVTLSLAALIPVVYFGIQPIAAAFFPGYDFKTQAVSILGSDLAPHPWILNSGAMLCGVLGLVGSFGLAVALPRLGSPPFRAWLASLMLAWAAFSFLWAGVFPLPDPRHGAGFMGMGGMLLFPPALLAALWGRAGGRAFGIFVMLTLLAVGAMALIMSGKTPIDLGAWGGLVQRFAALIMFLPLSVGPLIVRRSLRANPEPH
jgi:hypothetical membrane protein